MEINTYLAWFKRTRDGKYEELDSQQPKAAEGQVCPWEHHKPDPLLSGSFASSFPHTPWGKGTVRRVSSGSKAVQTSWRTVSTAQNPHGGTDQVCSAPAIMLLWGRWKSPRCTWPSEQCTLGGRLGLPELSAEQHKVDPLWSTDPPSSLGLVDPFSLCSWTLFESPQH